MFKKTLNFLDKIILNYLGIKNTKHSKPVKIQKINDSIYVITSQPFKRHLLTEELIYFVSKSMRYLENDEKIYFENALGKIIGADLLVTFNSSTLS